MSRLAKYLLSNVLWLEIITSSSFQTPQILILFSYFIWKMWHQWTADCIPSPRYLMGVFIIFSVFTASCGQKAMRVARSHIYWVLQDFLSCWWFNCVVLLHNSLCYSVLLLFLQQNRHTILVSHLENVWSLRLLNQEMPWVLELMKSCFMWICVLRLIDVDAKENENVVAVPVVELCKGALSCS